MQKRNSLLFLLTWVILIPVACFLSFNNLYNILEFIMGVVWLIATLLVSIGFWKLKAEKKSIIFLGLVSFIFAMSFVIHITDAPSTSKSDTVLLILKIILWILCPLELYVSEIVIVFSIRFLLRSFRLENKQKLLDQHLSSIGPIYQSFSETGKEALLLPLVRKNKRA